MKIIKYTLGMLLICGSAMCLVNMFQTLAIAIEVQELSAKARQSQLQEFKKCLHLTTKPEHEQRLLQMLGAFIDREKRVDNDLARILSNTYDNDVSFCMVIISGFIGFVILTSWAEKLMKEPAINSTKASLTKS